MKNFFKAKKAFFLSLIVPIFIFISTFLYYKKNPVVCGDLKMNIIKCESFFEYLNSITGMIQIVLIIITLAMSLFVIAGVFFLTRGKRKIGYSFLVLFFLLLIFFGFIFLPGFYSVSP